MKDKLEFFQKVHDEAVRTIKRYMDEPSEISELVNWLLTTDSNPYVYLTEDYRNMIYSAPSFAQLLNLIHYSVVDDGDITFVKVNGEPRIVFAHKYDDCFMDIVLDSEEKAAEKEFGIHNKVEVLDITANEFGRVYDEHITQWTKNCFLADAAMYSLEFAIEKYKQYNCWNDSWVKEYKPMDIA